MQKQTATARHGRTRITKKIKRREIGKLIKTLISP